MSIFYPLFRVKFLPFLMFFFLIFGLAMSNVYASSSTAMSMPAEVEVIPVIPSVTPVINIDPAQAIPLGLGDAATGGSLLSISVGISDLSGPVDLYVGLQSSVILGGDLLLFAADNTLHAYSSDGFVKWKSNTTGGIPHESILPDIPVELLPEGTYNFYFLMVPAGGNFDACRLWITSLNIKSSTVDFSGTYSGTFWGTDSGNWQATINRDGSATGSGYSSALRQNFTAVGEVDSQGRLHLVAGSASVGSTFSGHISCNGTVCKISGTWINNHYTSEYGSFSGQKR